MDVESEKDTAVAGPFVLFVADLTTDATGLRLPGDPSCTFLVRSTLESRDHVRRAMQSLGLVRR